MQVVLEQLNNINARQTAREIQEHNQGSRIRELS
jgi:hypothetical protein